MSVVRDLGEHLAYLLVRLLMTPDVVLNCFARGKRAAMPYQAVSSEWTSLKVLDSGSPMPF